jgi:hypothetical protein
MSDMFHLIWKFLSSDDKLIMAGNGWYAQSRTRWTGTAEYVPVESLR